MYRCAASGSRGILRSSTPSNPHHTHPNPNPNPNLAQELNAFYAARFAPSMLAVLTGLL